MNTKHIREISGNIRGKSWKNQGNRKWKSGGLPVIISEYMDLRRPRVYRRSNVGLVFSCDQAALWMVQSVCPSVHPSVCLSVHHTFLTFSGLITNDRSDVHAKGQGHLSNFKVTPGKKSLVLTIIWRFRTVTTVWIGWWLWNDAKSLK